MTRAAIGLGSNLGDRLRQLREAASALPVVARSRVYETEPVGPPQPAYLNAVVLIETEKDAHALLDQLLAIEARMGRVRRERWGPRTIDLDVLLVEGVAASDARLVVPHPHLEERAFALVPLLEVWPDAKHPITGRPYASIAIDARGVRPLDETNLET